MLRLLLIIILFNIGFSIELPLDRTALLLEKGQKEIGLWHPYRLGKTNDVELSMHPVLSFIIPNLKIKGKLLSSENSINSYSLKLTYPTPLLKLVQKEGIGGLITPNTDEVKIPHIMVSDLRILTTYKIKENHLFTISGGIAYAVVLDEIDSRVTIDLPYFFPRMNMYSSNYSLISAFHFTGKIWKNLGYDSGGEFRYTDGTDNNIAFEFGDYFYWQYKSDLKIMFGYNLYYAEYPFGKQWDLYPMIDLRYSW